MRGRCRRSRPPRACAQRCIPAHRGVSRMLSGHQYAARWRAHGRSGIAIREAHPFRCQPVDIRCANQLLPVATEVEDTHIVGHDENEVWGLGRRLGVQRAAGGGKQEASAVHNCNTLIIFVWERRFMDPVSYRAPAVFAAGMITRDPGLNRPDRPEGRRLAFQNLPCDAEIFDRSGP